jgi:hypothetical protein
MVSSGGAPVGGGRSAVAGCAQADAELEGTHWRAMDVEQKQQQHAPSNNKRAQLKDVRRRWTTCSGRAHARTTCGGTRTGAYDERQQHAGGQKVDTTLRRAQVDTEGMASAGDDEPQ